MITARQEQKMKEGGEKGRERGRERGRKEPPAQRCRGYWRLAGSLESGHVLIENALFSNGYPFMPAPRVDKIPCE